MKNETIKFDIDTKDLVAALAKLDQNLAKATESAVVAAAALAEGHMKINVRDTFETGTGKLVESIYHKVTKRTKTGTEVAVGSWGTIYARIHEFGGTIKTRTAPYLHFKTKDGKWHKVKQVVIPERSYIRKAINENKENYRNLMTRIINMFLEGSW